MNFLIKVLRNAGILAGLMFVSSYATQTISYELIKPIILFFLGYTFTELAMHYKLPTSKKAVTLIF